MRSPRQSSLPVFFILLLLMAPLRAIAQDAPSEEDPQTIAVTGLASPTGIAVNDEAQLYITEADHHRVTLTDHTGQINARWTGPETDPFCAPHAVAIAPDGRTFLADTGNCRIIELDPQGNRVQQWGSWGVGPGQFINPSGLAFHNDLIYVADTGNDRIQVFDRDGEFIRQFGSRGDEAGQFRSPVAIAIAPDGRIFVADYDNHRIQRFSPEGDYETGWGDWGSFPGLFAHPTGLVIFDQHLYVSDLLNHRVQIFSFNGEFLDQWGMHPVVPRDGNGRIHYPNALTASPDGSFFVVAESFEHRVQIFSPDTATSAQTMPAKKGQQSHFGTLLTLDGSRLAVWEPEVRLIYVFDLRREQPINITQFGEYGRKPGQFGRISAMALADAGAVLYVADAANDRLMRFALSGVDDKLRYDPLMGVFQKSLALRRVQRDAELAVVPDVTAIAVGPDNGLILLDARNRCAIILDQQFNVQQRIDNKSFRRPCAVAVNPAEDQIHIADEWAGAVFTFDTSGTLLRSARSAGEDRLIRPVGVTLSGDGSIFVSDAGADHIVKYAADGEYLASFSERGSEVEQLWKPGNVFASADDRLFIVDYGNHRNQIFSTAGEWLVAFGAGRVWTRDRRPPVQVEQQEPTQ